MSPICVCLLLGASALALSSCGGSSSGGSANSNTTKLPPGTNESEVADASTATTSPTSSPDNGSDATGEGGSEAESKVASPGRSADLYGARITVVSATRPDSNASVTSSSGREVAGDYYEVEMTVQNVATDHLVDLSEYEFRLQSAGINAGTYSNYYGDTGTYGKYVSENVISASLLDYTTLQPVDYKVKVGETVSKVFLFFDLNPENTGSNPNVTKDNANVIVYKASGTDYGEKVGISLAGYKD